MISVATAQTENLVVIGILSTGLLGAAIWSIRHSFR